MTARCPDKPKVSNGPQLPLVRSRRNDRSQPGADMVPDHEVGKSRHTRYTVGNAEMRTLLSFADATTADAENIGTRGELFAVFWPMSPDRAISPSLRF